MRRQLLRDIAWVRPFHGAFRRTALEVSPRSAALGRPSLGTGRQGDKLNRGEWVASVSGVSSGRIRTSEDFQAALLSRSFAGKPFDRTHQSATLARCLTVKGRPLVETPSVFRGAFLDWGPSGGLGCLRFVAVAVQIGTRPNRINARFCHVWQESPRVDADQAGGLDAELPVTAQNHPLPATALAGEASDHVCHSADGE